MPVSELEQIGYEAGMKDGLDYAIKTIMNAMDNPVLDVLTSRQTLGILVASLREESNGN